MLKIWITGSTGQIGSAINKVLNPMGYEVFDTDHEVLDITDLEEVLNFCKVNRPQVIINCAGIASEKECSENPELAYKVNALGARNIAIAAFKLNAKVVQISTDDVFDGTNDLPITEFDKTNPITVYGKSKFCGENFVKEFATKHFIIRSSWVYGEGNNFVTYIMDKAKRGEALNISKDQKGTPTSAKELARFILYIINTNEYGTYHFTCGGRCSRIDFTKEILKLAGLENITINKVDKSESEYSTNHPSYAVLDNFILKLENKYKAKSWQDALSEYIKESK
ncbi:MAG: dTDP-4-dehydrorhamnose reductase [Sphaerochaetaceae bacterium]|nr:dTDP-4-dehydrorhamnose reductase [Sphaerochaetaceae bacterium]